MDFAASALGAQEVSVEPGKTSWVGNIVKTQLNEDKVEHLIDAVGVLSEMSDILAIRSFASLQNKNDDAKISHSLLRAT